MTSGGEGGDAGPGPDQSESARHFDFPFVADSNVVDMPFDHGRDFAFFHPRPDIVAGVHHSERGEFVGEAHAFDLLRSFDHAQLGEKRSRIDGFSAGSAESVVEALPIHSGLADHAVANL